MELKTAGSISMTNLEGYSILEGHLERWQTGAVLKEASKDGFIAGSSTVDIDLECLWLLEMD